MRAALLFLILALPAMALAQGAAELPLTLVRSSADVESALYQSRSQARQIIEGNGSAIEITYTAGSSTDIFIVPMDEDGTYDTLGMLRGTLPQTTEQATVSLDMTQSPMWSLNKRKFLFLFLSAAQDGDATFYDVQFSGTTVGDLARAFFSHAVLPEVYAPSTYHVLRGYTVLSTPVTPVFGILAVIAAVAYALWWRKRPYYVLLILLLGHLAYGARVATDITAISVDHLREWYTEGTYDEARGVHAIGAALAHLDANAKVYVCRDGTNYREKILRYVAFPVEVLGDENANDAGYALVMGKRDWTYENGTLRCGMKEGSAEHVQTFYDGTQLYRITDV